MNLETLNQENMKAVQELAKINLEISAGKEKLSKMKESIDEFLIERDRQDRVRFDTLLKESKEIVNEIDKNNTKVHDFYNELKSYSGYLNEFCTNIKSGFSQLNNEYREFSELVESEMYKLSEIRKINDEITQNINLEKKQIDNNKKELEKEKLYIESQRETLKASYEAEKRLFDKLKSYE